MKSPLSPCPSPTLSLPVIPFAYYAPLDLGCPRLQYCEPNKPQLLSNDQSMVFPCDSSKQIRQCFSQVKEACATMSSLRLSAHHGLACSSQQRGDPGPGAKPTWARSLLSTSCVALDEWVPGCGVSQLSSSSQGLHADLSPWPRP